MLRPDISPLMYGRGIPSFALLFFTKLGDQRRNSFGFRLFFLAFYLPLVSVLPHFIHVEEVAVLGNILFANGISHRICGRFYSKTPYACFLCVWLYIAF